MTKEHLLVINTLTQNLPLKKRLDYLQSLDQFYDLILDESKFFIDTRDYNVYSVVKIGNQEWLGENLRYKGVRYYENPDNPNLFYGCLYDWQTALTACPASWHLPTDDEWKELEISLGLSSKEADEDWYRGSHGLEMKSVTGWRDDEGESGNGTNSSGFNAFPAGYYYSGSFGSLGPSAFFWSATEYDATSAWSRGLYYGTTGVDRNYYDKTYGRSCRYIKK